MTDLDAAAAIEAVRGHAAVDLPTELDANTVPGFPEFWYVTLTEGGRPMVGGEAFVVDRATGQVTTVPGSRPPRLNCELVRGQQTDG